MIKQRIVGAVCAVCVVASGFIFSQRSNLNLQETRPELQAVAQCAIKRTPIDFVVVDGGRSEAEHKINVANDKSWVKRSRHQDGAAIDFAAYVKGKVTYETKNYSPIAEAFYSCSRDLHIPIIWGGEWKVKDYMHIELDRRYYP